MPQGAPARNTRAEIFRARNVKRAISAGAYKDAQRTLTILQLSSDNAIPVALPVALRHGALKPRMTGRRARHARKVKYKYGAFAQSHNFTFTGIRLQRER